jgi:serine/threonine protein kinase
VGVYEVIAQIGQGGMGQVFRATDTKLKRQVAIKILPPSLAADHDRLARFQREAEVLASLNHPHIAGIYGLEESAGITALVMELVEGEDLSQRIARGAIPLDEALPIAKQIAEALEAAHEQGVIHRDLKPANIKVRADGTVKVLDFGLAKAMEPPAGASPSLSMSPTITTPAMTQAGMLLGTAAYMSPEQARGKTVDKRADIWAFGAVLFEMLTGRRAFEAEDVSLTLAEVMKSEPDWNLLPAIPPALGAFLRQCLKKDPKQRAQSMGDVRLALEGAFEIAAPHSTTASATSPRPLWKRAIPVVAAAAMAGVAGRMVGSPVTPSSPLQLVSIMLPGDQSIAFGCTTCSSLAISPDGTQVAYVSTSTDAVLGGNVNGPLHVRSLGSRAVRDLPGTTGAHQPFFSPDGEWLAFFTNADELKRVALAGGNPITVLANGGRAARYNFGVWVDGRAIVIDGSEGVRRVSDEGGLATTITTVDAAKGERRHWFPEILAGTETLLFTVEFNDARPRRLDAVKLDGTGRRVVLENASAARYLTSGHLVFQRDGVLLVAPFDSTALALTGPAVPLADDVRQDGPNADGPTPQLVVSRAGTLAYVPGVDTNRVIGVVSRTGAFEPIGLPAGRYNRVAVASNGQAVAFDVAMGATTEVRIYDLARGSTTKVTEPGWSDSQPAWHPNGRALAVFSRKPDGARGVFLKEPGRPERLLVSGSGGSDPVHDSGLSWSPDGSALAYAIDTVRGGTATDIWVAATGNTPEAHPVLNSPAGEYSPAFSPDGRWLAYVSEESGRSEVYARKYPQGERFPVSASGGNGPVWSGDGKEIFFQTAVGGVPKVMAASVSAQGDRLVVGKPAPLFDMRVTGAFGVREHYSSSSIVGRRWDVFPDGRRFLMVRGADPQGVREIVLVQHWGDELRRLTSAK